MSILPSCRSSLLTAALISVVHSPNAALAQQAPAASPERIVLRAARMLDVTSGQIVANPRILVEGSRIVSVNPTTLPAGARLVDLGDVTLMPGFIDAHTHLAGEIGPDMLLTPVTETEVDAAYKAAKHGRTTVLAGFTTVRDFGGSVTVALFRFAIRRPSARLPAGVGGRGRYSGRRVRRTQARATGSTCGRRSSRQRPGLGAARQAGQRFRRRTR